MKGYEVLLTEPAAEDLEDIARYISIELKDSVAALKLIQKIRKAVMSLVQMPTRNRLVADERLAEQGIRKLAVDNYLLFYVISEKDQTVTVVRILYGRRDWLNLL